MSDTPLNRLGRLLGAAFEANHPAMIDWAKLSFDIAARERDLAAANARAEKAERERDEARRKHDTLRESVLDLVECDICHGRERCKQWCDAVSSMRTMTVCRHASKLGKLIDDLREAAK